MQEKTLTITGEATKAFAPDTIVVSIEHSQVFDSYEKGITHLAERTKETREKIVQAGLEGDSLKTNYFEVEPHYERYRDSKGDYRERFVGYRAFARFQVAFSFDNKTLSGLLNALKGTEDKISFGYRLSNPDSAKEEVMALAAKAAIRKAGIIAEAASITLGDILNIDCSVKKINVEYDDRRMMCFDCASMPGSSEPEIDITPNDLSVTDSVTIIYALK